MSRSVNKLPEEAANPCEIERAAVAGALIEDVHDEPQAGAQGTWEQVIERRVCELEAGTAETLAWSEVRARLFSGFWVILALGRL